MSDVDVLVVLRDSDEPDLYRRIREYLPYFELDRDVDVLVYSRAELEARLDAGDEFLSRIYRESVPL